MDKQTADFGVSNTWIPAELYTSADVLQREKERMWPRVWQIACREEELPEVGDYVLYEIFDESVAVVRTGPDEIKAFYNVCQPRGRRLLDEPRGRIRNFFCRFHGWKWNISGEIAEIPHREEWSACGGFSDDAVRLKEPRAERWAGWVWVNMDPEAPALLEWLGEVVEIVENFDLADMRLCYYERIIAPVNWKVVVEAFNEGYHSGATHGTHVDYYKMRAPAAVHGNHAMYFTPFAAPARVKREDGTWFLPDNWPEFLFYQSKELHESLKAMIPPPLMATFTKLRDEAPKDLPMADLFKLLFDEHRKELEATGAKWPERLTLEDMGRAGTSWHLFPNTIFLPVMDGVLWYRMNPHGDDPKQCVFDIMVLRRFAPGEEPEILPNVSHGFDAFRGRNTFLEQDFDNMFQVDRGMRSRGWEGARLNPVEELTIAHFHRMLEKFMAMPPV